MKLNSLNVKFWWQTNFKFELSAFELDRKHVSILKFCSHSYPKILKLEKIKRRYIMDFSKIRKETFSLWNFYIRDQLITLSQNMLLVKLADQEKPICLDNLTCQITQGFTVNTNNLLTPFYYDIHKYQETVDFQIIDAVYWYFHLVI